MNAPRSRVEKARPRVILDRPGAERRSEPDLLDWKARFGRRSPLSRKIITFNLVALGVLLAGVLYLNQYQGGILQLRQRALVNEARLVAHHLVQNLPGGSVPLGPDSAPVGELETLRGLTSARILLTDAKGAPVGIVDPSREMHPEQEAPAQASRSAFTAIMGEIWDRTNRLFAAGRGTEEPLSLSAALPLAARAVESEGLQTSIGATATGQQILSAALPLRDAGGIGTVVGAVVLTTRPGDVDSFIRSERDSILQVFALAIITSIVLSLVLAGTIVRPLRDLAEAAHEGGTRNARQVNPERINIPEMAGRPDEIGYLSSAMRLMTEALFDRIEANESFAADVAHEIKNPLTSLRSAVDTMPYAKTEEQRARLAGVIRSDVNRLDRLVTDISNASRLDSELVRDQMEPFDLHALLSSLIEFNGPQAEAAGARLVPEFCDRPLTITGLEGRLAQVFVNLITNAISFAGEGDRIRIRTEEAGGRRVRVTVEDEGPGIPDQSLGDVFKRFYSERPESETFGNHSGLGLAISRQIVQAHGGEIWAENVRPEGAGPETPPQGARFVVELPV